MDYTLLERDQFQTQIHSTDQYIWMKNYLNYICSLSIKDGLAIKIIVADKKVLHEFVNDS